MPGKSWRMAQLVYDSLRIHYWARVCMLIHKPTAHPGDV